MIETAIAWLETQARQEIAGCRRTATDGTLLFTPDGQGNYGALWTRDFAYAVENAYHLLLPEEVRAGICYLLRGQRADGCIPDRVQVDGRAVYSAGPVGAPLGDPPTDNAQFMVSLVHQYVRQSGDLAFARQRLAALRRAMDGVPRSINGLVQIPPGRRQSPYGFTDTVAKSGELCFSSLLYWEAARRMAHLCARCDQVGAPYLDRAAQIERGLNRLWDAEAGAYRAATGDCSQVDVWASAFAVYIGFARGDVRRQLLAFLRTHYDEYAWHGQVRHLLRGEHWHKTLIPVAPGSYQNGAYWATASGWVWDALCEIDPPLANRMLGDLLRDFREGGICECVSPDDRKLEHYVVSAVNPLGALIRRSERQQHAGVS
jgi:hypothetical protein